MFFNIFFIIGVVFCKSTRKDILVTKLKKQEALSLLSKPVIFNKYLDIVKATDIILEPNFKGSYVKFPQKIIYHNYPKVNFFPYTLPKTKIIQFWEKDKYKFIGNIKCIYIELELVISIEGEENVKIVFNSEIKSKKFFVPDKILDVVIGDLKGIMKKLI